MPYIAAGERPAIDRRVDALAKTLAVKLERMNGDTDVSVCYREAFAAIARTLRRLDAGRKGRVEGDAGRLAVEIFSGSSKDRTAWLGRLNYAVTTLIQKVPKEMVARGEWREEFRYWLYAETVGALERAALEADKAGGRIAEGLVGVFVAVKDEYKRRVNTAYEAVQIAKAGDCYSTPYRTELTEVRDSSGKKTGYQEVMKDYRG
jgi:hypothetical protein